ncbi:hypothetical protein RF11_12129 [Thelohanellus kitauei]|uniref:Uncharacterized protein n=1 Tax=Thelohanellus kitauei TaxID=669202 RepID=A0A0C2MF21_THEKT|nr:hypothetical protein RF11_12129 [Thelohanellus kitauei]
MKKVESDQESNENSQIQGFVKIEFEIDGTVLQGVLFPDTSVVPRRKYFDCTPDGLPNIPIIKLKHRRIPKEKPSGTVLKKGRRKGRGRPPKNKKGTQPINGRKQILSERRRRKSTIKFNPDMSRKICPVLEKKEHEQQITASNDLDESKQVEVHDSGVLSLKIEALNGIT